MYLKKLKIRNFRNFYKSEMDFNSEDNILIGDNGSGKTNLFCAIRLVLDSSYKLDNQSKPKKVVSFCIKEMLKAFIISNE